MDLLIYAFATGLLILSLLGAIVINIVASECYDLAPSFARWLIERTVARLPEDQRERYREEWLAHVGEYPAKIGKIIQALGFWWNAGKIVAACTPEKSEDEQAYEIIRLLAVWTVPTVILGNVSDFLWFRFPDWNHMRTFSNFLLFLGLLCLIRGCVLGVRLNLIKRKRSDSP